MSGTPFPAVTEGRPTGGPLVFRTAVVVALAVAAAGCAGPGSRIVPRADLLIGRPLDTYRQLGFLTGTAAFPAVAGVATLAGPADSTYVLFGLSLPARALHFQRDGDGFAASYDVAVAFERAGEPVRRIATRETVRVSSYAETVRADESIVYQQLAVLAPGEYALDVEARDALGTRGFRARDTIVVPAYGPTAARLAPPLIVYAAGPRPARDRTPDLILNPRHTFAYGDGEARVYLEAYGLSAPGPAVVRVLDEGGVVIWSTVVEPMHGDAGLRAVVIDVPDAAVPVGRLRVEASVAGELAAAPLILGITDQWVVANFEEVLQILRLIALPDEIRALREAAPAVRRAEWDGFWQRRNPVPSSPVNEFRDVFFERVRVATEQFTEAGVPGWRTARGEVHIVLGRPDGVGERRLGRSGLDGPHAIEWVYERAPGGRLVLVFVDRGGFGRYDLTPASDAAFRVVAERLRRQARP